MDGNDWLQNDPESPEAFGIGDIAKGVFMPHTIPLKVANTILKQNKPAAPVVKHTQPPPLANNAREVQGQLAGLLRTVKGVENKVDGVEQKVALVQRATAGNNEAERFQQSLVTALLSAAPLLEQRSWLGALAHAVTIVQGGKGIGAAFAAKPITTIAWPAAAAGLYLGRQPRRPVILAAELASGKWRVTMFSPDGGNIYYEKGVDGRPEVTKNSDKYLGPFDVDVGQFPFRARAYVFVRGSEQVEFTNPGVAGGTSTAAVGAATTAAAAASTVGGPGAAAPSTAPSAAAASPSASSAGPGSSTGPAYASVSEAFDAGFAAGQATVSQTAKRRHENGNGSKRKGRRGVSHGLARAS